MTVVFLHAFPFDPRMWGALPPGAEAPRLYDLGETMDDWARAILDRFAGGLVLVGASMGGYAAYHVARLAPERVRGLLTVGARPQAEAPGGRARRDRLAELVRERGTGALWEELQPTTFSRLTSGAVLEQARTWALEQQPDDCARALVAMRDRRDTSDLLKLVDPHPTIVLGELDELARPADFENVVLAEHVQILREAGHLPNLERPDRFDPILEEFLQWTRSR